MIFWIRMAGLYLVRSWRSTAVLAAMVFSAVSVLIFLSALVAGITDAMIKNSVSLFSGHISGFGLPVSFPKDKLLTKEVSSVLKRSSASGILENGDRFEMVVLVAVNPGEEKKSTALWKKIVQGRYIENGKNEIVLSLPVAEDLGISPGQNISFRKELDSEPVQLTVSGLYETGIDRLDRRYAFCPDAALVMDGKTHDFAIFLKTGYDVDEVVKNYHDLNIGTGHFKTWKQIMPDLKQLIELNDVSMNLVMLLVFGVVSIGIACAFAIFILKNLREYGIMKSMGITSGETAFLIFSEVILMNIIASFFGIIGGITAVYIVKETGIDLSAYTSHNPYFTVSGIIYPRLTVNALSFPPILALAFSMLAALWPAVLVSRKRPVDILRSV